MSSSPLRPGRVRAGASVVAALAVTALLAGCGSTTVASAIRVNALTVDGTSISRKSFERDISALSANAKLKALDQSVASQGTGSQRLFDSAGHATRVLTTSWLNRLVNQIVVDQEFAQQHLKVTADDETEGKAQFAQLFATSSADGTALVKAFPAWFQKQEDAREARLVAVTRVIDAKHPITQAQERDFYTKNVGSLCASGFDVSHILVKTLPEAQAIETQLTGGAKFSDLATQKSIDTTSAKNGGSLGCLASGEFVTEFQNAAEAAKVGVPTAPVKSQFGYHVILKTKFVPPPFATLEPQIRQQILQTLNLVQKFVAAGLKKATVRVDSTYGTWNKKTFRVDAPAVPAVRNSRERDHHHADDVNGRVVVVGLGPAGADLMLPAARTALERNPHRYARTVRHPAATELIAAGVTLTSFDAQYEAGADLDGVYAEIVEVLLDAARVHGEVAYAVPGSPTVAEHTVVRLHALAAAAGVAVDVVPGLSFADLAWARLGLDSFRGGHVVDARGFATSAAGHSGPLLIAQCDNPLVLSEVKLALLEVLEPDAEVTVLARLGLPDESVSRVALADLDRVVVPDHLTSLFVDTGDVAVAGEFAALVALTERLRGPGGCPWDAEQTHHSLARHLLEEAYEVAEAIDALPADAPLGAEPVPAGAYDGLEDELGDLLFQVVIHSVLAREAGAFTIADVARGIHTKLVRRHPHVFGTVDVDGSADVVRNWEQIKREEKQSDSLVAGVPMSLPSLLLVPKLFRKADSIGLAPEVDAVSRVQGALDAVVDAADADALGELLGAVVALAWRRGLDPEAALRGWARSYRDRFAAMERAAAADGLDLATASPDAVAAAWDHAAPRA